ncbi:MAG: cellulose biosynthesis protein BcsG, partial [Candidatus Binatia bacterium]
MSTTEPHAKAKTTTSFWTAGWAFYFIAKLYLAIGGRLNIVLWHNLLLFVFVFLPVPGAAPRWVVRLKTATAAACALMLLWSDSWLPPLRAAFDVVEDPWTRPSLEYIASFVGAVVAGWLDARDIVILGALFAAAMLALRRPVVAVVSAALALAAMLPAQPERGPGDLTHRLQNFYEAEARRKVPFEALPAGAPSIDIVFLHVCSLSWDDLAYAGLDGHPFLAKFDYWFSRFNSAASYSDVAGFRLLRSPCGQQPHADLYEEAPHDCYLFEQLRRIGYRTYTVLNHTGEYAEMAKRLLLHGRADPLMKAEGLPASAMNFDDTPISDDYATLERWWTARQASRADR